MPAEQQELYHEDARLVARVQAGESAAFRQLFVAYSPLIYRIVFRMLGDREESTDLTQEIFVKAYQRLASLHDGQAFRAWLTRLAVNMVHDRARRFKPALLSLDVGDEMDWQFPSDESDGETRILAREQTARVRAALLALSPDHRAVVVLHHLEGLPVDEIGALLRIPAGTVKSRLARARAELRRTLEATQTRRGKDRRKWFVSRWLIWLAGLKNTRWSGQRESNPHV